MRTRFLRSCGRPKSAGSKKQNEDNLRDYKTPNYYGHPMGKLVRIMEYDRVTS
jgi:hypothetical protein